jgi:hypothetical protein
MVRCTVRRVGARRSCFLCEGDESMLVIVHEGVVRMHVYIMMFRELYQRQLEGVIS